MSDASTPVESSRSGGQGVIAPGLYLVSTPIGNLEDITLRGLRVLRAVDRIACEDTRQTAKLLSHFGIQKPTVSLHLHNEQERAEELIAALRLGARIALVSDAGTPGIADPGTLLVRLAITEEIPVFPVPGASAVLPALVASGFATEQFSFAGFLPAKAGQRRTVLEALRSELSASSPGSGPVRIFYETPHRILETLADLIAVLGPQHRIVVARELTKVHEEFLRGTAAEVLNALKQRPVVRGEIVLLIDGTPDSPAANLSLSETGSLAKEVGDLMQTGISEKDALKQVARNRGLGKSEVYREWQRGKR